MSKKRGKAVKTDKSQGQSVQSRAKADDMKKPQPQQSDRGIGSEFAYAVKTVLEESRDMKGSSSSFLGVDKEIIDPKELGHSFLSHKKQK